MSSNFQKALDEQIKKLNKREKTHHIATNRYFNKNEKNKNIDETMIKNSCKTYHALISRFGKSIDKYFPNSPFEPKYFEKNSIEDLSLQYMIADHLKKTGRFNTLNILNKSIIINEIENKIKLYIMDEIKKEANNKKNDDDDDNDDNDDDDDDNDEDNMTIIDDNNEEDGYKTADENENNKNNNNNNNEINMDDIDVDLEDGYKTADEINNNELNNNMNIDNDNEDNEWKKIHKIANQVKNGDLLEATEWIEDRYISEELRKINSSLPFQIARMRFIQIISEPFEGKDDIEILNKKKERNAIALQFARGILTPYFHEYNKEILKLMGALIFTGNLENSPYSDLLSSYLYEQLAHDIISDYLTIKGLPNESHLMKLFVAGLNSLPVITRILSISSSTSTGNSSYTDLQEMPVSLPILPSMKNYHSIFTCPVSRELSSENDPPVLLGCGHVLLKSSMESIARGNLHFKCPTCPHDQQKSEVLELKF